MVASRVSPAEREYRVLLLGAPALWHGGARMTLRRRQVRALIYYLGHESGPTPRERLAHLFWAERPEAAARRNLTRLLSAARAELEDGELLISRQGRVALDWKRVWSDCVAFDRLADGSGRERLEEAEGLYRGRFLEGFSLPDSAAYSRWQDEMARAYERRYLALLLRLVEVCEGEGDLSAAMGYARRYLAVDELAEEVHRKLIELYAADGDRAAAARQFETCTLVLERELGVRPLPETRAAYEAAMAEERTPARVTPSWSVLPSLELPLMGREEAWQALSQAHRRLKGGGLILISGEPGVGKSRLMQAFATESGSLVLAGNNPPGEQTMAYTALAEALRQALARRERWQGIRPIWLAELGRLLPEMREVFPDLPRPVEVEASQAQARLFEGVNRCLLGLARQGPLLLCLDDVHWADAETMGWLTGLAPRLAGSDVCVLATYRSAHAAALADVKRAYARAGRLGEVALSRLARAAVGSILEQLPERPPDPRLLAGRIHHATGGNTFFVLETVRVLMEAERLTDPPDDLPLAPTVEAAIRRRLDNLSPLGRQVLETAAVLGTGLRVDVLQETAGRSDLEVAEGLDEVVGRQLLVDGEERRFSHDLVRQVTYEEISPWRRRILHGRAAGALEGGGSGEDLGDGERPWAAIAGHYDAAGEGGKAIRCYEKAAEGAQQVYAHEEAAGHLRRAIELCIDDLARPAPLSRLQALLGDSLLALGQHEAAENAFKAALDQVPPDKLLLRVTLQRKVAESFVARHLTDEAERALELAMEMMGRFSDVRSQAWQQAWLEIQLLRLELLYLIGDLDRLAELATKVEPKVEAVGTATHRADFMVRLGEVAVRQEHFTLSKTSVGIFRSYLAAAQETEDLARIAHAHLAVGFCLLWSGELDQAAIPLLAGLEQAEAAGLAYTRVLCLTYLSCLCRFLGETAEARRYGERSLAVTDQVDMPIYLAAAHANLAWLAWREGTEKKAEAEAEEALAIWGDYSYPFRWLASWVLLAIHTQRRELAEAVEAARAILHPSQRRQPGELPEVLETAVIAWEEGDEGMARRALARAAKAAREHGYL